MLPLYDKYVQSVGSLNIMDGAISIEITREGKACKDFINKMIPTSHIVVYPL